MAESGLPSAAELRRGYRKGMVLGLTLAEVALLLVFVLLLLLASGFERRDRLLAAFKSKVPVAPEVLEALQQSDSTLREIRKAAGARDELQNDDFLTLVKNQLDAARALSSEEGLSALRQANEQRQRVQDRLSRIERTLGDQKDAGTLTKTLAEQTDQIENQQGQIRQLQDQLASAGAGRVLPSCWTTPDGKVDYLFDVALTSQGLRVDERASAARQAERGRVPMARMDPATLMQPAEFQTASQALFRLSQAENCRYYVVVYDVTASSEKDLYKHLLDTVEDHFYKLKVNGMPPFAIPAAGP